MKNRLNPYGQGDDLMSLMRLLDAVETAEEIGRSESARARKIAEAIIVARAHELYDALLGEEAEEEGKEEAK